MDFAPQPKWEFDVLSLACDHIKLNDSWSDDMYPIGGVHISPKPIDCKIDSIEINLLYCNIHDGGLTGLLNVNIFHTDTHRIIELTRCVELIMNESYLEGFLFNIDFGRLFKQPHGNWLGNIRYNWNMSMTEYKNRYGNKSKD